MIDSGLNISGIQYWKDFLTPVSAMFHLPVVFVSAFEDC